MYDPSSTGAWYKTPWEVGSSRSVLVPQPAGRTGHGDVLSASENAFVLPEYQTMHAIR